jgi:hypothetical protein
MNSDTNNFRGPSCTEDKSWYWDYNNLKYVGWDSSQSECEKLLFTPGTVRYISNKLSELLRGVDPTGKKIVVTDDVITSVLTSQLNAQIPQVGDIYSRYIIMDEAERKRNDIQEIINRSIQVIYEYVKNEIEMEENNQKLSIWNTVYGDFNSQGLRQTPPIKTKKRRPDPFLFNMNY